jgi:hypothetical protein
MFATDKGDSEPRTVNGLQPVFSSIVVGKAEVTRDYMILKNGDNIFVAHRRLFDYLLTCSSPGRKNSLS